MRSPIASPLSRSSASEIVSVAISRTGSDRASSRTLVFKFQFIGLLTGRVNAAEPEQRDGGARPGEYLYRQDYVLPQRERLGLKFGFR